MKKPEGWIRKTADRKTYAREYRLRNIKRFRKYERAREAKKTQVQRVEENRKRYVRRMLKLHGSAWQPKRTMDLSKLTPDERRQRRNRQFYDSKKRRYERDPDYKKARKCASNGRRRSKSKTNNFTRHDIADLLVSQNGCCKLCSTDIRENYEVDHVEPLTAGGSNAPTNIQLLCKPCNVQKGGRSSFG